MSTNGHPTANGHPTTGAGTLTEAGSFANAGTVADAGASAEAVTDPVLDSVQRAIDAALAAGRRKPGRPTLARQTGYKPHQVRELEYRTRHAATRRRHRTNRSTCSTILDSRMLHRRKGRPGPNFQVPREGPDIYVLHLRRDAPVSLAS
jgi:hypothetical protein